MMNPDVKIVYQAMALKPNNIEFRAIERTYGGDWYIFRAECDKQWIAILAPVKSGNC